MSLNFVLNDMEIILVYHYHFYYISTHEWCYRGDNTISSYLVRNNISNYLLIYVYYSIGISDVVSLRGGKVDNDPMNYEDLTSLDFLLPK